MRTPYASRRDRRCSSPRCAHGGRIRRGQEVIRYGHRQFMHTDDVTPLLALFAQMADAVAKAIPTITDWITEVATAFSDFAQRVAVPMLRDQAEADAAHLVDLLWIEHVPLSIRPVPDHPGSVRIVVGHYPTLQGTVHLPHILGTHGVTYDVVAMDPIPCRDLTLTLTRAYREHHGIGLFAPDPLTTLETTP